MTTFDDRYPASEAGFFRASNSAIEAFLRCGLAYWKHRESKERFATVPMVIGTAVARAAQMDNRRKEGVDRAPEHAFRVPLAELVDAGVAAYDEELGRSTIEASRTEVDQGRDDAAAATRAYGVRIAPSIRNVRAAERTFAARFDSERIELVGTPDLIETGVIRDTKTGQPWNQRRVDRSRQLTGYDLLHEAHYGVPADRVAVDSVHRDRRGGWTTTTLWSRRTDRDRRAFIEIVARVRVAIERGVALPAPEGAWWCADSQCPFWRGRCTARPGA